MKSLKYLFLSAALTTGLVHAESAALGDSDALPPDPPSESARPQRPDGKQRQGGQRPDRPSREEILTQFDADGDGKLSETEREAAREFHMEQMALRRFDADGDGALSEEERSKYEAFKSEREAKMLDRFDADGDGVLSDEERQTAREAFQQRRGKRQGPPNGGGRGPADSNQGPPRSTDLKDAPPPPPGE
ncbi:EF-hand domain-containing protein [Cerasicoccus maritimus]|uniref:EF-hand domain-containing protein n=1 Tax=Cerasicoccus maritimus TaxID=490089 RepID=UPI002852B460|nr:EF-hand domain-containing protein [Cerasicoccus maritimus]